MAITVCLYGTMTAVTLNTTWPFSEALSSIDDMYVFACFWVQYLGESRSRQCGAIDLDHWQVPSVYGLWSTVACLSPLHTHGFAICSTVRRQSDYYFRSMSGVFQSILFQKPDIYCFSHFLWHLVVLYIVKRSILLTAPFVALSLL